MTPSQPIHSDIILLGAGHAHVEVLRRFAMAPQPGVRLTLIGREPETPYSGMLPAVIRGECTPEDAHIDLAPLAAAAQARLILAEATAIDLRARTISVEQRPPIPFDLLSINLGGIPQMPADGGVAVKPIGRFLGQLDTLHLTLPPHARLAIIGGGAAGVELALALATRFGDRFHLTLVASTAEPLATAPAAARRWARAALVERGVAIVCGVTAGAPMAGRLPLSDGSALEIDQALWATGVVGPALLADSGLACDPRGCVQVGPTLESVSHPGIFAAGDCAVIGNAPRPKAGVWAVRAGAPLAENLRRRASGKEPVRWKPQRDALAILGTGQGSAIAWRNGIAVHGRLVARWKDRIDRRWMSMYKSLRMPSDASDPMRCGGCGAKVGAEVLDAALAAIRPVQDPALVVGLEARDDAAVLQVPAGQLLVQSVDHFRGFLDDPYLFGQIAAAHALSDLHAMGARPWTALAVATVPFGPSAKMRYDLSAMLRGATEVLDADGCALVGGHSAEGAEPALGFAVTGLSAPSSLLRKGGARAGDTLILTKPLGTGIVLAGNQRGLVRSTWLLAAIEAMCRTNRDASGVLVQVGATACTDVTGFGLIGHLWEMLGSPPPAPALAARLWASRIPLLPGVEDLVRAGIRSTLAPSNEVRVPTPLIGSPIVEPLIDPQTSGGLVVAVPSDRTAACLDALAAAGVAAAAIGVVESREHGMPWLSVVLD